MKKERRTNGWMTLVLLVFAAAILVGMGGGFLEDIRFQLSSPTDADRLVKAWAEDHGYSYFDYPQELIDLLERNPEAESFVLEYPAEHDQEHTVDLSQYKNTGKIPLFLQWDKRWGYIKYGSGPVGLTGCGPVCLSMAAFYLTGEDSMSPDKIVAFALENGYYVPGSGSSWTLISEGGVQLGLDVTEIPLDEGRIRKNLDVGNPIICAMGPGDFTESGHYIVLTGATEEGFTVNDPNSPKNSEAIWPYEVLAPQIRNLWVLRN